METYNIPRRAGWEQVLEPLVRKITGAQQADCRGGCSYDCELFFMQPHFLGTYCECTYGIAQRDYAKENPHSIQCFHTFWREIDDAFKTHPKYNQSNILKVARTNMVRQLCVKNKIKYEPRIVREICTCPFEQNWKSLELKHDDACKSNLPNFWFKETDLKIWWYRFFFREAHSNLDITILEFEEIVKRCMDFVNLPVS